MSIKPAITFLLPADNRSGGVRVTTLMGNLLLLRGYRVRIAMPSRWRQLWANPSLITNRRPASPGWLHSFNGSVVSYGDINRLRFAPGEIVIGVGTYMIADLQKLKNPHVLKVRSNHGLPAQMTTAYRAAWSLPIPTITVSSTLVAQLERLSGQPVRAVIPNGIDLNQYFSIPGSHRDAIGTIYGIHPNKAPHDIVELLRRIALARPETPRVVFSTEPKPPAMPACAYEISPSIARAREFYNRAFVWLLASHAEGMPGPVLEAMACGAVVISTDNEGSLSIIRHGVNGLIVPKGDFQAFLEQIQRVREDDRLRTSLVRGGFETAARFTWDAAADKMENFIETLPRPVSAA